MHTQVSKWGHSLAVRIPKAFAHQARLMEGQPVEITIEGGQIVLTPVSNEYSLQELLAGITKHNIHPEFDMGKPAGRELW